MSQPLKLDNTMGAAFIGVVVAASLWAVSCVQVWYYANMYPKDPLYLKLIVAAVLTFDTTHQMLITHTIYTYLVTNFANPRELGQVVWSLVVQVLISGLLALLVQCFLAVRVWRLSNGSYILTGAVFALVLAEFVVVIIYVVKGMQTSTFVEVATLKGLSMTINAVAAAADVLIAAILCTMLQKSRTGFKRSDTMINKLIIFSVNTGLATSICAVGSLVSIIAAPNTFIYIAFFFNISRCYSNTLFATLNARQAIRNAVADESMSVSLRGIQGGSSIPNSKNVRGQPTNINIKVDTTHEFTRDHDSEPNLFTSDQKIDVEKGSDETVGPP